MNNILVVDDIAIFRDLIASCLRVEGFQATTAANGREAVAAIQAGRPDLILLDVNQPGMAGLAVLRLIRAKTAGENIPVILLTITSDKSCIVDAAKMGVRDYLLKHAFSLQDLLARIRQILGAHSEKKGAETSVPNAAVSGKAPPDRNSQADSPAASVAVTDLAGSGQTAPKESDPAAEALAKSLGVSRLLTREQCVERAEMALQGKALSGVVAQVIQLAASSRSEMSQVADSISHDPMLTAKVLRVSNSSVYATSRGPVTTIQDAIKKIGFSTIRNIAATVGVFEAMPATNGKEGYDPIRCWQHSFAVATLCERLAANPEKTDDGVAGVGYLAGLCHDLGEILFQTCYGNEYKQVLEAQERTGHPIIELEKAMLGMPSPELMNLTLRCLGLPDAIRAPIEAMHSSTPIKDRLGSILRLSDIYANGMLLASSAKSPLRGFSSKECERVLSNGPSKGDAPALDRERIRAEIYALTALLSQMNSPGLTKPLFARTTAKVWLAREPGMSKLDPVEAALDSMSEVQVKNRLPSPEEANELKALAVESRTASVAGFTSQNISALQAACKKKLPTLWLVNECDEPTSGANSPIPAPITMPAPLETLAKFLIAA